MDFKDFLEQAEKVFHSNSSELLPNIDETTDLFRSGLLDSLRLLELILLVEQFRGRALEPIEYTVDDFATLDSAFRLVTM